MKEEHVLKSFVRFKYKEGKDREKDSSDSSD